MFAKKILFPTDFSPASEQALTHATSLARDTGAKLFILHVVEPPITNTGDGGFYSFPAVATTTRNAVN